MQGTNTKNSVSQNRGRKVIFTHTSSFAVWTLVTLALLLLTGLASVAGLSLLSAPQASAVTTVPTKLNFQGRLTDSTGNIKTNGTYNMKFKLYTVATAGTAVWSEDRLVSATQGVTVTNGLFSVQLGSITSLPASLFASGALYLEVELPTPATATSTTPTWTEGPMTPRNQMATSAYAYNSETLDGQDGAWYQDAANLTGTVSAARLSGAYGNITGLGTLSGLTVNGVTQLYVSTATNFSNSTTTNWIRTPKNTVTAYLGDTDSTTAYTTNDFSGNLRFNGTNVNWGDFGYYPNGGGNGNYGQFRFSVAGSAVNTTPNAKLGVGSLYSAGSVGVGTATPGQLLDVQGGSINTSGNLMTGGITRVDASGNLSNIGTVSSGAITSSSTITAGGVINTTAGGAAGTGTQSLASAAYVQSRGMNLATNGSGLLGNNYNFTSFSFDQVETYTGKGSFKNSTASASVTNDEFIPVDISKFYKLNLFAKSTTYVAGNHAYFGISQYDVDNLQIAPNNHMYQPNTTTTLAQPLAPGDTTVYLTSAANWNNAAGINTYLRNIIVWGYTNSYGYTYPDNTYSRRAVSNAYADGGVNYVSNSITLSSPWPATWGTIPSGTAISNGSSGGSYKYMAAANVVVPNSWTNYNGEIGGIDTSGTNMTYKFAPGTANVKLLFLLNRDVAGNVTNVSNVSFSEVTGRNANYINLQQDPAQVGLTIQGASGQTANLLQLQNASAAVLAAFDSAGNMSTSGTIQGSRLTSTIATGTAPLTVTSTTLVANLNADLLDGQSGAWYQDAANLTGTVNGARLSGAYTGITALGNLTGLTTTGGLTVSGTNGTYSTWNRAISSLPNNASIDWASDGSWYRGFGATTGKFVWYTWNGTTYNERMALDSSNGNLTAQGSISGTTLNGTTGLSTGAGAGAQRIDASGNLTNIGTFSSSGNITTTGGVLTIQGAGTNSFTGSLAVQGSTLKLSNFHPEYRWQFANSSTDANWKKVADVTFGTGLYRGGSFQVDVTDANCNWGCTSNAIPMRFYVNATRSGGVQDDTDSGSVAGPSTDYVRLVKTALGVYELQVRSPVSNRTVDFTVRLLSDNGTATVTYASSPANGSTVGTIYTSSLTGYTQNFANINVGGNTTFNGTALFKNAADTTAALKIQNSVSSDLFIADTTNMRIQIGSATADGTGVLLVLDTKNSAGDPTGTDGAMYYNSSLGKFRCYEMGAWKDCITPGFTVIAKSTDQTITGTTYVADTELKYSLAANSKYRIKAMVLLTEGPTAPGYYNVTMAGPAGSATSGLYVAGTKISGQTWNFCTIGGGSCQFDATALPASGSATAYPSTLEGYVSTGATAGDVTISFGLGFSSHQLTIKAGSTFEIMKLP